MSKSLRHRWRGLHSDPLFQYLFRGSTRALAIKLLGQGLNFTVMLILARLLGVTQYGVYVVVIAWLNILSLVARLGFDTVTLRFGSTYLATSEWALLRGLLRWSTMVVLSASTLLGLGAALLIAGGYKADTPHFARAAYIGCAILPLFAIAPLRQSALLALGRVVRAHLPEQVFRPLAVLLIVPLLNTLAPHALNATSAMGVYGFAIGLAFVIGNYWLSQALPAELDRTPSKRRAREWLHSALPMVLFSGAHVLILQTDTLMLSALSGMDSAGIYSAASRIAILIQFGMVAIQSIAAPQIAALYARGQTNDLQRLLCYAALGSVAFALPCTLALFLWGRSILGSFGDEFVDAYPALVVLALSQLINAFTGLTGYTMTMTGHQIAAMRILLICAGINLVLNALAIPSWGIMGAAVATFTSACGWNLYMVFYIRRHIGLMTLPLRPL